MDDRPESPRSPVPVVTARPVLAYARTSPWTLHFDLRRVSTSAAVVDLILVVFALLGAPLVVQFGLLLVLGADALVPSVSLFTILKWTDALVVVALTTLLAYRHRLRPESFGLQTTRFGWQLAWSVPVLAVTYLALLGSAVVILLLITAFPELQYELESRARFLDALPLDNMGAAALLLVAVAIHEELLFRGLLIPYLHRLGLGWAGAIALSTTVFALLHYEQGWLGVIQILPIGLVLAVAFVLTRSLTAVIVAHFCFDLAQMYLARSLLPWAQDAFDQLESAALIG